MNTRSVITATTAILALASFPLSAADLARYNAKPGNLKMRVEGTSNIHDWQVESSIVGGYIEVGPNFPAEPGQSVSPGKVDARAEAYVPVRSLFSIEKDGRKYSDSMDGIMYEKLKATEQPRIIYRLKELTLKEPAKNKDAPYVFDSKGELAVAGVTNTISMPVNVTPLGDKKIKVTGTTTVKMTDFKIEPPAPKLAFGLIKTGDEVKIIFDWLVAQKPGTAAASAK